jgi:hypothetical protein
MRFKALINEKIYLKLLREQKARGVIFSSQLISPKGKENRHLHEVHKDDINRYKKIKS